MELLEGLRPIQIPPKPQEVLRTWALSPQSKHFYNNRSSTIRGDFEEQGKYSRYCENKIVVFKKTEKQINQKLNWIKVFWPASSWCSSGCQKWVTQWIQSAFGMREWNKSNSDNQAKCLSSASFSHVATPAKSDFCQQSSYPAINISAWVEACVQG